ncbi:Not1-domain-containing protein [Pseudovirgaria hyperparasitica]|uniref:General negative regulator of transcription subunit 1 n=1 Tax=Pseudovirgaria hyperparasitica TaxID=470096 RepID=A0A6A6WE66_9PEZI|nr:Not1-domain-containing protein [Pseudovirgaria hyperparasitica]KAF2761013.1 Not1-domain-containing protein [Pseudovirgaria hyperparasitica]
MSQQFSWGSSSQHQSSRRGLTPISTALNNSTNRSNTASNSPSRPNFSPANAAFPGLPPPRHTISRNSSTSSTSSPFTPNQSGSQQPLPGQLLSSARSRTIASTNNPHPASSAAALSSASQTGGANSSSGGGGSRLARASPSLSQPSTVASPSLASNLTSVPPGQSLAKIVIAQVFLLLSTIKDDKAQAQTDQIRKLVDSNGMEVFSKYFKRLLVTHAGQVFDGRPVESANPNTYNLLVTEMQKILQDPQQAQRIAESVDTTDGDIFRNFDLSTFMEHFKLDPVAKTTLALAFKTTGKSDLRTKADAILTNNYTNFLHAISQPADELSTAFLASVIERLAQYPPRNWNDESKYDLRNALVARFRALHLSPPAEIGSALYMVELMGPENHIVRTFHRAGPQATATLDSCKETLSTVEVRNISYTQVTSALLYMVICQGSQPFNATNFVAALREHRAGQRLDWQDIVHSLDRETLRVTKQQFLSLYRALLPLAQDYENFDIQLMWGGAWKYSETQLSFVVAFLSCSTEDLDAEEIPRLRKAYSREMFEDASDEVKGFADKSMHHPMASLDATSALFTTIFRSPEAYNHAQSLGIPETVINANTDIFLISAAAVPKPWGGLQDQALRQLFHPFLIKSLPHYQFVMHGLWKQDYSWIAGRLIDAYTSNHMLLIVILEHAHEHGWIPALIQACNELSLDLAAQVHARDIHDINPWAQEMFINMPQMFPKALGNFLHAKAENELHSQREKVPPTTVPLAVKTVQYLLSIMENQVPDEDLVTLQRACIQSYPRLINYGEGFDGIIDQNGKDGNSVSADADEKMQEHYRTMYAKESDVRDIVDALRKYKTSEDPADQDLFACMIHGLFDEYNCFGEYPLDALATTAVLFGGIINYRLLSRIALQAGLAMVLEAVQESQPDESMYKFGLQALLHFSDRLQEWPSFCDRLLRVPGLVGTEVFLKAQDIVGGQHSDINGEAPNGVGMPNGTSVEDFLAAEPAVPNFTCLHVGEQQQDDVYEEPDEDVSDKVLFVLNNVSERNLKDKLKDLKEVLEKKHHQWFANYLVEERAKMQPNFQNLYLDMLQLLDDKTLWAEVLRETYVSVIRMLNCESTVSNSTERTHLKNLGGWLGSLTIARDKPILFKNISFKDLLIQGHDTQRLVIVIPFTCKVLVKAASSTVFRPPNPWLMEIIGLLLELYQFTELKLNLKFEIEVLCQDLKLNHKNIEPSTCIRARPPQEEFDMSSLLPEGMEGFSELSLMGLNRNRGPSGRFSPAAIAATLPDLRDMLSYPPGNDPRMNNILLNAAQQAVAEIIAPVVERSVTIAAISTQQLVAKDFALEPDEEKLRGAAHNVVKSLSGSLALVTCKEPLRMSIMNNIRVLARDTPNQALPEGLIMMFVNDNLDLVCNTVEQAAEMKSLAEIDLQIEELVRSRRMYRQSRSNEPFKDPSISQWAFYIPEPYKQSPGGLNQDQQAIYEEFGRQVRPAIAHANTASQDSSRQVPDVLQEPFPTVSTLPNPAEAPAAPRQNIQPPPRLQSLPPQQQINQHMNGFLDHNAASDRLLELMTDLQRAVCDANETRIEDLSQTSPISRFYDQILALVDNAGTHKDMLCLTAASKATNFIYSDKSSRLEVEVFVMLLSRLCQSTVATARQVIIWLDPLEEDRVFNAFAALCLLKERLLDIHKVDVAIARALMSRREIAIEFLSDLMDEMISGEVPIVMRSDFAVTFEALSDWLTEFPDFTRVKTVLSKLNAPAKPEEALMNAHQSKEYTMEYAFIEWGQLQRQGVSENTLSSFISQLRTLGITGDKEATALFLRTCIAISIESYEVEERILYGGSLDTAYVNVDALARLIVALVAQLGPVDGAVKESKPKHFERLLSVVVLLLCQHHHTKGEGFNQKVFFRLFASIICELQASKHSFIGLEKQMYIVMGKAFLAMQPVYFPCFAFGWLALIAHRIILETFVKNGDDECWEMYTRLIETALAFTGELVKSNDVSLAAQTLYRAVLRLLLVIHHDFPEFLAENHFRLCNAIPAHCTQLRNLVLSAYPSSFPELPDPFMAGLKIDRLEEVRKAPVIRADIDGYILRSGIKDALDNMIHDPDQTSEDYEKISQAINTHTKLETGLSSIPVTVNDQLLNAIVIYVASSTENNSPSFNPASGSVRLLEALSKNLRPEATYYLLGALANQLRWPNSHTCYYSYMILHLFGSTDSKALEVQQIISRILLERLIVHRPHPWGLIITLLEIMETHKQAFWNLPFIKATPEVERLFHALFQHIQQNPRSLS